MAALGLLVVGAWLFLTPQDWATLFQRDLRVYQAAIDAFAAGDDPYQPARERHGGGLLFTSPPFVWLLYKLAAHSALKPVFGRVLLTADVISIVAIPAILSPPLLGPRLTRTALGAGFFFTAFAGAGFFTALVINNGTPLYALIAAALIPAVKQGHWLSFHLAVALATAFKPFYAAFWIVSLLADGADGGQWAASAVGLACASATYIAPFLVAPKLMAAWLHVLARQTVGEGLLGDNLLGALLEPSAHDGREAAYLAQVGFSAVLVSASLMFGRMERTTRIAALLVVAVFLNPRVMRYDLSMAAVPLLGLVASAFYRGPPTSMAQAAWAVILAGVMIVFSRSTPADGVLYAEIVVAALLGAIAASYAASSPAGPRGRRR